jgi:hypothetical protein
MTIDIFESVSSAWHASWNWVSCDPTVAGSQVDAEQMLFRVEMLYEPDVA